MTKTDTGRFLPRPREDGMASVLLAEVLNSLEGVLDFGTVACGATFNDLQKEIFDRLKKDSLTFARDMLLSLEDRNEIARRIREPHTKG